MYVKYIANCVKIRNQVLRIAKLKMKELIWQLFFSCRIVASLQLLMYNKMLSSL